MADTNINQDQTVSPADNDQREAASYLAVNGVADAEEILEGQATPTQIADWKDKHPKGIYAYKVDDKIGYLCNPNRKHMNAAMNRAVPESPLSMYEGLAKLTWLGGCKDILTDDELFMGLSQALKTKMDGKKGEVVNL